MESTFDFNTLNDQHGDGEHGNDQGTPTTDLHDAHVLDLSSANGETGSTTAGTTTPEVTSTTTSKGKHGKKHQDEPAPAPVAVDTGDVDLSTPLAPTMGEGNTFLRFMPALVKTMNAKGVPFSIDGNTGNINVAGFYNAGGIVLKIGDDDVITAVDRREKTTVAASFDDLVKLNYEWWIRSNGKNGAGRITPDRPWLDEFLAKGWIKRVVIFVPRDEAPGSGD
ncbi:hypothetical protein [Burkholderia anthina]|uniref:hypothetical protein n=1 Tax=Burkholderia anthina TaxID=179879 RepID=UPI0037BF4E84